MLDQRQRKIDVEQELQAFGEALRQTQTCAPAEIVQHYNDALFHLKRLSNSMVVDTLERLYQHNLAQIDRTRPYYSEEAEELRHRQPMLERTWRERLKFELSQ